MTVGSLSITILPVATLSASTYLNVVFNQAFSSSGTTSSSSARFHEMSATSAVSLQLSASECSPHGGGDIPEDVLGGLNAAANLSWQAPTRFLVLIGDAPAHGQDCTKPNTVDT